MDIDKYKGKYRIPSNRLAGYDYGSNGAYFITVCTHEKINYLGEISEDSQKYAPLQDGIASSQSLVSLSEIGEKARQFWMNIPQLFSFVIIDEFIIMPNHLHGILIINKGRRLTETQSIVSLQQANTKNRFGPQNNNLASIIRGYKSGVKSYATQSNIGFKWQANYYDRIIRNEKELDRIRNYIYANPFNWKIDKENPQGLKM